MLMPSIFGESLFDSFMDPFDTQFFTRNPFYGKQEKDIMKTDVKEVENGYELAIDLPGYKKEDVHAQLENGYLTINASKNVDNDKKDENGKYIRRERYTGSMSRSFYVGEQVTEEDIHAKFEDGILHLSVPKKEVKKVENNHYIAIEG
ncbi:hypothetical protein P261_02293 [Lachnospiraceae bacterium TWA4]|nr:hypothetical protein P261_02293 [Lachnospiraceae bacterium TWA4]